MTRAAQAPSGDSHVPKILLRACALPPCLPAVMSKIPNVSCTIFAPDVALLFCVMLVVCYQIPFC